MWNWHDPQEVRNDAFVARAVLATVGIPILWVIGRYGLHGRRMDLEGMFLWVFLVDLALVFWYRPYFSFKKRKPKSSD